MNRLKLLNGRYQFIKILGTDGWEQTYLVGDTQVPGHPRCVVRRLQVPVRHPRTLKFVLILLKKKAESLQKVGKHDQVPQILAAFEEENNFYLVEEFVPGRSLQEELQSGEPLPEAKVVLLLWQVLEILEVVHGWGVIHRCIKPSNLIRRAADDKLVLTGFGIFREISAELARSPHPSVAPNPQVNGAVYKPAEQRQGQLHPNADLYAVGMIGIQALTGLPSEELVKLQLSPESNHPDHRMIESLSWRTYAKVSPELANILDRMVHPDSEQRYPSATTVLDALRRMSENHPLEPLTPPPPTVLLRGKLALASVLRSRTQAHRWLPGAIALLLGLGLIGILVSRLPQTLMARYWLQQGTDYEAQGSNRQAIERYTQAIQSRPSSDAYFNRGIAQYQTGDLQAALADLTEAIQLDSARAEAYYQRGNVRFELGDRQGAVADYTEAIALDPRDPAAYVNRGNVRADLGDSQGAVNDYGEALQLNPNLTAAYLNRCLSQSNLDRHQAAIADCNQAISLQPDSVLAYQNRGLVRRRLGDINGAISDFNIAIRLNPEDADPYYNRGLARVDVGDLAGAIADFSRAIELNPAHPFAYYDRGLARVEIGAESEAIADLEQSAKLCLDTGRMGCYEDAQYHLNLLRPSEQRTAPARESLGQ